MSILPSFNQSLFLGCLQNYQIEIWSLRKSTPTSFTRPIQFLCCSCPNGKPVNLVKSQLINKLKMGNSSITEIMSVGKESSYSIIGSKCFLVFPINAINPDTCYIAVIFSQNSCSYQFIDFLILQGQDAGWIIHLKGSGPYSNARVPRQKGSN